jgi:hypothetical protein
VLFVKSDSPENSYRVAISICRRIISCSSALAVSRLTAGDTASAYIKIT